MSDKEYIESIILKGTNSQRLALYAFNSTMQIKEIIKRFNLFVIGNFPRYYTADPADFHSEMIGNYIKSYLGKQNFLNIGYRGCAKTTIKKLFDTYVLLNDRSEEKRKYFKVLTRDMKNSKQLVTDVYNLMVEVGWLYGDVFEKEGKKKREETMSSFTMRDGRKYASGTVGQVQRGHVQDAYRPDWIWGEDIEDSTSIRSVAQTVTTIEKMDEAIQGMSDTGNYVVTANYISQEGIVEWLKNKADITVQITPILINEKPTWGKISLEKIEKIKADAEDWEGDYMCDPSSGKDKFFDITRIKADIENTTEPIKEINHIKIWEEYSPHYKYAMGGDTAEGVGEDSNALTLFNMTKGSVIATFHSNTIAPDMFGYEMARLGRLYGECLLAPEINNTGHATVAALREDTYSNIYREINTDKYTLQKTDRLGWNTTRKTKPLMWFDFKKDYEAGAIIIRDVQLLKEMLHYTKADFNERSKGVITRHFDLLTSAVIGWQMRTHANLTVYQNLKTSW